ncbi:molybdopterin molybdotransferase MoeA [Roseisalinus antarcticus]|uniref:Molybdopterin molybdenumtransferase n=1 Tax=Roseisalinus antarcticus TaxID=254357 RepID=A0A1Y5RFA8_9RHOB|nr:molybdopterin molybdotransferase MoeA [Roseisalinus antarcticus]SLN16272.1 Molybdopterin molybdenumtransferase [Roseisalinus antarcticus]
MISVAEALERLFGLVVPTGTQTVPLTEAAGRYMTAPAIADRTQPPFAASAMDGYAFRDADLGANARLRVIGEAAAGAGSDKSVGPGEAIRIFTGAPLPQGADRVVIQEDVTRDGDMISIIGDVGNSFHIRPMGADFKAGHQLDPRVLTPGDVALLAAMNLPRVTVARKPVIALLPTGNELVQPGEDPGPDQVIASNSYGLHALLAAAGAAPRMLPVARDTTASLEMAIGLAEGADLLVTIGGASVGDHDLVGAVTERLGMDRAFYKVAMRPGKPLIAGRIGGMAMVGLPGNPVSAMVCGTIFLRPMVRAYLGQPAAPEPRQHAPLAAPLPANGPREHYMRATLTPEGLCADKRQDSALLSVLAAAGALIVRPPGDAAREIGEEVPFIRL